MEIRTSLIKNDRQLVTVDGPSAKAIIVAHGDKDTVVKWVKASGQEDRDEFDCSVSCRGKLEYHAGRDMWRILNRQDNDDNYAYFKIEDVEAITERYSDGLFGILLK